MINLQTKGFDLLTPSTKEEFQKIWEEYSKKLERKLKNIESLRIHIKEHNKGGKTKFSIIAVIDYAGKSLKAEDSDWDLRRTFHKVFNKLQEEAEHKFHVSDQHQKRKRTPFD
jgi:ribosome-associated translation inhibitor RaiA